MYGFFSHHCIIKFTLKQKKMKKTLHKKSRSIMICTFIMSVLLSFNGVAQNGYFGHYLNHISSVGNSTGDYTSFSDAWLDGNSSAQCLVTACYNPNGVYNNFNYGVWYTGTNWALYNEDATTPIPDGSSYNVVVPMVNGSSFLHNSDVSTIVSNWTDLDNAATNSNPNALVFFTHNWSVSSLYNNKAMGVWYDGTKWAIYNEDVSAFPTNDNFNVFAVNPGSNAFVQTATSGNIVSNWTVISNPYLDGNPYATIIVSHNYSANASGVYMNHPIGVWYDGSHWTIYNQDLSAMPVDAAFNVLIANNIPSPAGPYGTYLNHISTVVNSVGDYTYMSNDSLNYMPAAHCIVTASYNPNNVYNNFNFGVWYTGYNWSVYNEDATTPIPDGSSYNVLMPAAGIGSSYIHNSNVSNIVSNWTDLDNATSNSNPNALVFFTHNWSVSSLYNNKTMGVWYDGTKWAIYTEDLSAFQANDNFNVFAVNPSPAAFVHTASNTNITSNWTTISNPFLDGNPNATIIVSHNYSANASGVYLDHPIGVWYDGSNWTIYNQDVAAMPVDAAFNVLILDNGVTQVNELNASKSGLNVFPSVANDLININFTTAAVSNAKVSICNISGQVVKEVYRGNLDNGDQHLTSNVSNLASGAYYVELLLNGSISMKKIIVSK
jgi:hypothetical protein